LVDKSIQGIYWLIKEYKKSLVDKSIQEINWLIKVYKESIG